jgi:hypothetical protein
LKPNNKIEELPLYIFFMAGLPVNWIRFYGEASKILNINLRVEYHGCIISEVIDENGIKTNDAEIEQKKYDYINIDANHYYERVHGKDWLDKVDKLAILLSDKEDFNDSQNEFGTNIVITVILNLILLIPLWIFLNIYIGLIICIPLNIILLYIFLKTHHNDKNELNSLNKEIENYNNQNKIEK